MRDSQLIQGSYYEIFGKIECEPGLNQTFHFQITTSAN